MSKTKVIIAGAGIAGPVLAIFLKAKGYNPIIYERAEKPSEHGLGLALQPNGLKVLSLVPGLLDKIRGAKLQDIVQYSVLPEDEGELWRTDGPSRLEAVCGFGIMGADRVVLQHTLIAHAKECSVPIVFGHQLVSFEETAEAVTVTFTNGNSDTASFLVGCDGLHSNTRQCLFGKEHPTFTGLIQTGGHSETPEELLSRRGMLNLYGDGAHMISYPINDHQISWAFTTREPEARETWRAMNEDAQESFRRGPFSQWPMGGGKLVSTGTNLVKYGLYDRPELQSWHQGRVVLLGDAAHPTSPHVGQGANQAFEDIYHLVRLLVKHNPDAASPSTELLSSIFTEYEKIRIPRTTGLVKLARKQGELRVVSGVEACKKRNDILRSQTNIFSEQAYKEIAAHPFEMGHSEVSLSD
ncbi:FAD/NAD-P-binding domain-containing protein [Pilatotrama ljubarskyi]|nr:FAD/NAD-P-binding domain-containing protein [Pilatotrama ljubarskyi]